MSAEGLIWEFSHISLLLMLLPLPHTTIAARTHAAVHCKCRSAQCPPSLLQLGLLLLQQRQWCVLTRLQQQGLCCCSTGCRQGPACQGFPPRPHWSDGPVRLLVDNVSTSLFGKNLRSLGLTPAGPGRAEFELCYFVNIHINQ